MTSYTVTRRPVLSGRSGVAMKRPERSDSASSRCDGTVNRPTMPRRWRRMPAGSSAGSPRR